jgi:hypothetical protein
MSFLGAFLYSLLINVLPLAEVIHHGRSPAVLLVMYWLETLLALAFGVVRIVLHRRATGKAGHYLDIHKLGDHKQNAKKVRQELGGPNAYLASYLQIGAIFTVAHGFFVLMLVFLFQIAGPVDGEDIRLAATWVLAVQGLALVLDIPAIATWPFRRLQDVTGAATQRVLVTQLGLIFGLPAMGMAGSPWGLVGVFIGLRVLLDSVLLALKGLFKRPDLPPALARFMARRGKQSEAELEAEFDALKADGREIEALVERPIDELRGRREGDGKRRPARS